MIAAMFALVVPHLLDSRGTENLIKSNGKYLMFARFAVLALLSLLVAACNKNPLEVIVSRCPAVAVVGDTGTLTRFSGEGRQPSDVAFTASIMNVNLSCTEGDSVRSNMTFQIGATAGDALSGDSVNVEYFVIVMKDTTQIITKTIETATLRFDSNGRAVVSQAFESVIPSIEQARRYNYEVLVGFQLTPDEVVYNMER
ncbi:hypothetical protein GCM10017044_26740 [Kordiimonas sediminis]|uniref:Uncharacterized protein n=1 Tax=Kordiimonas sediminis TaxID=1735581 RepID=A0A919AYT4_9PROT|nr:hypothetical protein [Kordiimonas sediminis]GHF30048.1 hypothetical protein GCM10017044_26740 [Kordiimonas sediminis]